MPRRAPFFVVGLVVTSRAERLAVRGIERKVRPCLARNPVMCYGRRSPASESQTARAERTPLPVMLRLREHLCAPCFVLGQFIKRVVGHIPSFVMPAAPSARLAIRLLQAQKRAAGSPAALHGIIISHLIVQSSARFYTCSVTYALKASCRICEKFSPLSSAAALSHAGRVTVRLTDLLL